MDAGRTYMGDVDALRCCPTATQPRTTETGAVGPGKDKEPFAAWGTGTGSFLKKGDYGSYGINGWLEDKPDSQAIAQGRPPENFWRKMINITNSSNVPLLTDAQHLDGWPEPDHAPPAQRDTKWGGTSQFTRLVQDRHNERQNCGFVDGSVKTIGLKELWTLKWHRNYNVAGPWTNAGGADRAKWTGAASWMANFKSY